jgi:hypothetical protein
MKTIPRSFLLFIVVAVSSTVFAYPAHAGRYELIKGKGVEVCEAYKKNLESFSDPYPVMACERKINTAFTDFEKPNWEKVDLEQHRELFRRVLRYQGGDYNQFGGGYYEDADLDSRIKEHKERGYPYVSRVNWNITPYGKKTGDILIYRYSGCPDGPPFHASNIYTLAEAPGVQDAMIDANTPMEKLLRTEISPNNGEYTSVGLFRHKGIPYIDKYCLGKQLGCTSKDTLIVFKYGPIPNPKPRYAGDEFNLGFQKICEYRYLNK